MTGIITGNVRSLNIVEAAVDLGSVAANTTETETGSLPGVKEGDVIIPVKPTLEAGLAIIDCRATADDTIALTVANLTGSPINEASETIQFLVARREGLSNAAIVSD